MFLSIVLLIVGLLLLLYAADRLVYGAAVMSRSFGISPLIIGMTIVGVGTSLPELVVSLTAAIHGQRDMAVGNVLGSNITNILLILASSALIRPLVIHSQLVRRELPLLLVVTILCGLILIDSVLSRTDAVLLLLAGAGFMLLMVRVVKQVQHNGRDSLTTEQLAELPQPGRRSVAILWLLLGCLILPFASKMLIDNASVLAHHFGISELVIALTLLAAGNSLPELATAIAGAIKGEQDMVVGNVIGSNVFNLLIILPFSAFLSPGVIDPAVFQRDFWVMLAATGVLVLLCGYWQHRISHLAAALLLCAFIAYLVALFFNPFSLLS
ncbi:calcium/sodium antiporter [Serratia microhaemolytica]|uniref:calcium/sodium antiporter n=1 Tax=Serratia microhaemolytica TaxID=2675110 RepID=UPI000FDD2605|nr:calcium/sodium antiporter [Serratia microhaemolytica]